MGGNVGRPAQSNLPTMAEVSRLAPDTAVLDYWFGRQPLAVPFLDGLRAEPATAGLPVMLAPAASYAVAADRWRLDRLVDGALLKPYRAAGLAAAVGACSAGETTMAPD